LHSEPSLLAVLRAVSETHNISANDSARAYSRAAPPLPAALASKDWTLALSLTKNE